MHNNMNKKAEIITSAILVVGLICGMIFGASQVYENSRYIGDRNQTLVYDSSKCNIDAIIAKENQVNFKSLDEAHNSGFKDANNCI